MRAWEDFLAQQDKELGKETVSKWLRPLKIVRFDACNLYLEAMDSFQALWFEEHIRHRVQSSLFNNNHKHIKVHLSIFSEKKDESDNSKDKQQRRPSVLTNFRLNFDEVDNNCSFENYVTCKNNLLVYKLLCETFKVNPETSDKKNNALTFNPIYLFGRSGTGKTHLMMASANQLKKLGLNVMYVRAETFTEHVVGAIRSGEILAFRKAYRNVDALFVDDIEIFSHKGATQEEFFHTFNTLHVAGKQILLSASCLPQDLKFVEPRLISRFEWGIVVPLHMPERAQMEKILLQRAEKADFPLSEDVISFLLDMFGENTKTLIRSLEALMLRTHLNKELGHTSVLPLSRKSVEKYLTDLIQEKEKSLLTPGKIIRSVAEYHGIKIDDILSKSQAREYALPRQIAMHLCRHVLNLPFMKIGDIFSRDHSTVMASVKQIQKGLEAKNNEISDSVRGIMKLLEH